MRRPPKFWQNLAAQKAYLQLARKHGSDVHLQVSKNAHALPSSPRLKNNNNNKKMKAVIMVIKTEGYHPASQEVENTCRISFGSCLNALTFRSDMHGASSS